MDVRRAGPPLPRPRPREGHLREGRAALRVVPSRAHWSGAAGLVQPRSRATRDATAPRAPRARDAPADRAAHPARAGARGVPGARDQREPDPARLPPAHGRSEGDDLPLPDRRRGAPRVHEGAARSAARGPAVVPRSVRLPRPGRHAPRGSAGARMVRRRLDPRRRDAREEQDERPARVEARPGRRAGAAGLAHLAEGPRHPRRARLRGRHRGALHGPLRAATGAPAIRGRRALGAVHPGRGATADPRARPPRDLHHDRARERSERGMDRRSDGSQVVAHDQPLQAGRAHRVGAWVRRPRAPRHRDPGACSERRRGTLRAPGEQSRERAREHPSERGARAGPGRCERSRRDAGHTRKPGKRSDSRRAATRSPV